MEVGGAKVMMLTGSVLLFPVVLFIGSFMFWPGLFLKAYNWFCRCRLGLKVEFCHSGSYRFCYSTRGTPGATPSLLLLHGFSASKDMWLPVVKFLSKEQHVVCLDLPGHEGTTRSKTDDYSIHGQVSRIHQFVQSVGLDQRPFHLVGTSMGGNVAGVYAARYPQDLCSVTLVSPAGLIFPRDSGFVSRLREIEQKRQKEMEQSGLREMEHSRSPESVALIPSTLEELDDMLRLCCYKPLHLPKQIMKGLLQNRLPHNDFYKQLFLSISSEDSRHTLQDNLHHIRMPLQVVWGQQDQVLDISGASVIEAAVPHCQVALLEDCGHSVALERPRKLAKLISDFLSEQEVSNGDMKKIS